MVYLRFVIIKVTGITQQGVNSLEDDRHRLLVTQILEGFSMENLGEWALEKAFGPVLTEIGEDLKRLYAVGRDKILIAGYKKIKNKEDGRKANLRVAQDVFWNGAFTDDEICAEYFGGILAASRSEDGKDDSAIEICERHQINVIATIAITLLYILWSEPNTISVE